MMTSERCGVVVPNGPSSNIESAIKVKEWADSVGFKFWYGDPIMNADTAQAERTYFFKNEQDKLIFLLRWSNTR